MARFTCDNLDGQFRLRVMPGLAVSARASREDLRSPRQEDVDFARQWFEGLSQEQWEAEGFNPIGGLMDALAAERGETISLGEALNVQAAYQRVVRQDFSAAAAQCVLPNEAPAGPSPPKGPSVAQQRLIERGRIARAQQ